jgi:hypothetical protein
MEYDPVARRGNQSIKEEGVRGIERATGELPGALTNDHAQIDRRSRIESRRRTGEMVELIRALIIGACVGGGRVKGVTRSVESVVNTQFSGATVTEMMDCSSKLALRTSDELESAGKAEQDRQQRSHLRPVKEQANRFETHFFTPGVLGSYEGHGRLVGRWAT